MDREKRKQYGWRRHFITIGSIGAVLMIAGAYNGWTMISIIGFVLFVVCVPFISEKMQRDARAKDRWY